ncbi:MAG: nuclear transport factor 2 family protein [Hyphomonadaceae bacterium]|nr:nuclear transport factor 2 family protein [Hyphomonadaceae bacterium]
MRRLPDTPLVTVQKFAEAVNRHDLDALTVLVAANCVVAAFNGGTETVGAPAMQAQFAALFEERPKARLGVSGRMSQGDVVAQHETISRGLSVIERRIALYTVLHEKIVRVDVIR